MPQDPLAAPLPDGLPIPEVGSWSDTKYRLVGLYDRLFSTSMKGKWDSRVYVDLFAGAGFAKIRGTSRLVYGSPFLALRVPDQFDRYIFCEEDRNLLEALQVRVHREFPGVDSVFISGDCNQQVKNILAAIPPYSRSHTVLSFCFVDPPDIGVRFSTVRALASRQMDFLVLLALFMDANRNVAHYVSESNRKLDDFLGQREWRGRWMQEASAGTHFARFLATEYSVEMQKLGHLPVPLHRMKEVRSDDKNLPLYHLALFSKVELAYRFWDQVLEYATDQRSFDF